MPSDEPDALVPYDPRWPVWFLHERARIADAAVVDAVAVEHIGATAVPGLDGRAVIEILVGVGADSEAVARVRAAVAVLGYEDLGEAGVPGRVYMRLRAERAFDVTIVERGGQLWSDTIAVRDVLRRDPDVAKAYAERRR